MLFQKKKDVIGIDIGSSSVKMVHLKEAKGSFQLSSLGMTVLPPEATLEQGDRTCAGARHLGRGRSPTSRIAILDDGMTRLLSRQEARRTAMKVWLRHGAQSFAGESVPRRGRWRR